MRERTVYFGDYIKNKRLNRAQKVTITQAAEHLGVSRAFYCDVENKRRKPFDGRRLELLAEFLGFTEEEAATMYDVASDYKGSIPYDVENTLLTTEVGALAQTALRLSKGVIEPETHWRRLISELEANKAKSNRSFNNVVSGS